MPDIYDKQKRSDLMSRVKSKNTKPEILVRSVLHSMGFRFRLHRKNLPGNPDIVLPKHKTVIFVHGCFWHQHPGCKKATLPQNNGDFWQQKLRRNVERDTEAMNQLEHLGWKAVILWECEIPRNRVALQEQLAKILD